LIKTNWLDKQTIDLILDFYYEKGYDQHTLAAMFKVDQGYVSRLINMKRRGYQYTLESKFLKLGKNIVPAKDEAIQGKILRSRRQKLHSTKLTWAKVTKIRKAYFFGKITQNDLAKKYGVNQSTISRIIIGLKWKYNE
jgi:DNA-binding transcriptional regulator LsrR (DeoR family)